MGCRLRFLLIGLSPELSVCEYMGTTCGIIYRCSELGSSWTDAPAD